MLIEELSKYGNIKHQYIGKGRFRNSSDDCDFGVVQLSSSRIYMICEFKSISDGVKLDLNKGDTPTFIGVTEDGKQLVIDGNLMFLQSDISYPTSRSTYVSNGEFTLEIGNKNISNTVEIRFNITNFIFFGTPVEQISETESKVNAIKIQLGEYNFIIRKVSNIKMIEDQLRAQKSTNITCQLIIKDRYVSKIDNITQLVDNMCGLLSIAEGTLISWVSFEIYASESEQVYMEHRPNITKGYGSTPLIDEMPPESIESFINATYQRYCDLDAIYDLASVARLYTSIRLSGFIEVRSLTMASLVEFLLNKFADVQPSKQTLIDEEIFRTKKDELKKGISDVYEKLFPGLDQEIYTSIKQKISDFNGLSFQGRLQQFVEFFCIPITQQEIREFIQSRNKLAHGLSFKTDDGVQEYQTMVYFFDRVLLGMLGYRGYYINFTRSSQMVGSKTDYFEPTC